MAEIVEGAEGDGEAKDLYQFACVGSDADLEPDAPTFAAGF